jgi:hypothetical protein
MKGIVIERYRDKHFDDLVRLTKDIGVAREYPNRIKLFWYTFRHV